MYDEPPRINLCAQNFWPFFYTTFPAFQVPKGEVRISSKMSYVISKMKKNIHSLKYRINKVFFHRKYVKTLWEN